jgi:hypothetical protein
VVPFVRVTRDKRGYELIYLMRASGRRGKAGAPRILYVFRTPPGVKVGREPFDDVARRAVEEQNPGVFFDWNKLSVIAPPPPDVEYWRERRRVEKAAKQAQREEAREQAGAKGAASTASAQAVEPDEDDAADELNEESESAAGNGEETPALASTAPEGNAASDTSPGPVPQGQRRRRRRRGGRGRKRHPRPDGLAQVPADSPKVTDDSSKER